MIQKNNLILVLITTLFMSQGCSTLNKLNPWAKSSDENYNALTYGEKAPTFNTRSALLDDRAAAAANEYVAKVNDESPGRAIASYSETGQSDALDPTDERSRGRIDVNRGLAVSRYALGDRATRVDFYDKAVNDGSLWSNDNDGNFFYTKNKMRAVGDIVSVKLEEPMVKHIAEEIKKSLSPAEQEVEMALYLKNSAAAKDDKDVQAYRAVASGDLPTSESDDVKNKMETAMRWSQVDLTKAIGVVPNDELRAEVIDRYPNGNYKVRAVKRVLYRGSSKLISMVGVAPATDFEDRDLINSGKLYEYKIRVAR